jgi:hypothetical protein
MLALAGSLLGGCTSLPDTSGYTAATIQVKQAVATTGDVVESEFLSAIRADATTANLESVKKFKAAWAATTRSLDAMVAHAQSIEQIVDAGNRGAASARQVADSVKTLVDTVKVDALTGASGTVFALSADTVAFVYGEYSKHVSAKSLEEALDKFGPSIVKIPPWSRSKSRMRGACLSNRSRPRSSCCRHQPRPRQMLTGDSGVGSNVMVN